MHDKSAPAIVRSAKLRTRPFDLARYLADKSTADAYLRLALEEGDAAEICDALQAIDRARSMTVG